MVNVILNNEVATCRHDKGECKTCMARYCCGLPTKEKNEKPDCPFCSLKRNRKVGNRRVLQVLCGLHRVTDDRTGKPVVPARFYWTDASFCKKCDRLTGEAKR